MKIYLIRHGQTTGDIEGRYGGDYDDHLTQLGKEQADDLGHRLVNFKIEKIYHSPRIRAVETAQIVHRVIGIPLEELEGLKERNAYGILTGKLISVAKEKYPDMVEELKNPKATIEGAEDYLDFKERVSEVFNSIADLHYGTVGIITHGGVISCFLREIIGRERKKLNDCAIIELEYEKKNYTIVRSWGVQWENIDTA